MRYRNTRLLGRVRPCTFVTVTGTGEYIALGMVLRAGEE